MLYMVHNIPVSKLSSKSVDSMSIDEGCPESFGGGSWMKKLGPGGTCIGPSSLTCGTTYMYNKHSNAQVGKLCEKH